MKATRNILIVTLLTMMAGPVVADWNPGDPHKMHYPQLPDPNGWDVRISNARRDLGEPPQWVVADDWKCTAGGDVTDVHFWVSWMQEVEDQILNIHLSIHANIPVGPDGYSIPGDLLWWRDFAPGEFTMRDYGTGDQGWYDPPFEDWWRPDHEKYYQINIVDIPEPFTQTEGEIYWLDISADLWGESELGKLGWKTSQDHFTDDAVYWSMMDQTWLELRDPDTGESLDMAFVITPEPATISMLALASIGVLLRRRKA